MRLFKPRSRGATQKGRRLTAPRSAMEEGGQILPVDGQHFQMRRDGD
jgi:hypothetical protein